MGEQVDVSYRGIAVGSGLAMRDFGPTTAYVEVDQPMPVGTRVQVSAGDVGFDARVVHVDERTEGVDQPGMRIEGLELSDAAQAWWRDRVSADDPAKLSEARPEPPPEADPESEPEAISGDQPSEGARTSVMEAVDVEQIEAMAKEESAAEFEARKREAEEALKQQQAQQAAEAAKSKDDADSPTNGRRKKRRKKRRKRRTSS